MTNTLLLFGRLKVSILLTAHIPPMRPCQLVSIVAEARTVAMTCSKVKSKVGGHLP